MRKKKRRPRKITLKLSIPFAWFVCHPANGSGDPLDWASSIDETQRFVFFQRTTGRIIPVSQWLFLVPLKGGRRHIIPQLAVYTTYILPSGGLYATYHFLGEPETTIELVNAWLVSKDHPH